MYYPVIMRRFGNLCDSFSKPSDLPT